MIMSALLATLFVHPVELPLWARLWMFLPLAGCIALVYRATRARTLGSALRRSSLTFVNIVLGMALIALAAWGLQELVVRFA